MARKKILWLCSWYPARDNPFNGDFIQRHARAAALYNDIHVIYAYGSPGSEATIDIKSGSGLTEELISFPRGKSSRFLAGLRWLRLGKRSMQAYRASAGSPDLVHVHIPIKAGLLALWARRRFGWTYLVSEHWGIYNDVVEDRYERKGSAFRRLTRLVIEKAAVLVSVSRFLAVGIHEKVTKKPFIVIPNAVDTSLFFPGEKKAAEVFRFIHVSNMVPLKNARGILEAYRELRKLRGDVELVMVGDTDPAIREYASSLGLGHGLRFTGEIDYAAVAAEMRLAHALVHFSDMENAPCVIGEAFCCGLPVIATNVGGIPEMIGEGNGMLVPPRDTAALTEAMVRMIEMEPNYDREGIAREAFTRFSYATVGRQFDDLYEKLLSRP